MWAAIAIHRARYNVLLCGWWALLAATAATSSAPHVRVTGPHHPSSGSVKRKNGGSLVVADFFPSIGTPANRRPLTKLAYSMDQLYLPQPRAPITVAGLIPNVQTSSKYRDGFFTQGSLVFLRQFWQSSSPAEATPQPHLQSSIERTSLSVPPWLGARPCSQRRPGKLAQAWRTD